MAELAQRSARAVEQCSDIEASGFELLQLRCLQYRVQQDARIGERRRAGSTCSLSTYG